MGLESGLTFERSLLAVAGEIAAIKALGSPGGGWMHRSLRMRPLGRRRARDRRRPVPRVAGRVGADTARSGSGVGVGLGLGLGLGLAAVSLAGEPRTNEPIRPIPELVDVNPEKVALGRLLFHDPRLSKDGAISCASCHDLASGGDDGRRVSIGVGGAEGMINSPTVFNSSLNFKQFWDGRTKDMAEQFDDLLQPPIKMGIPWPETVAKLHEDDEYPKRFEALYPDGINRPNIKDAISEFVASLVTPNSPFDQWLKGDDTALSEREKHGYALFKSYGCISCHQGTNVGGNLFQVFGVFGDYFKQRGNITEADLGRYNVTGNIADRHSFKVPSLRMAAHTPPYLHDGTAKTLRDAVDAMFEFQLGREAPDDDKDAIVAFIRTLAGESKELSP